jgi:hypothetical protein
MMGRHPPGLDRIPCPKVRTISSVKEIARQMQVQNGQICHECTMRYWITLGDTLVHPLPRLGALTTLPWKIMLFPTLPSTF